MRNVLGIIEQLQEKGETDIGRCVKKTVKNWEAAVNTRLEEEGYNWRVVSRMEHDKGMLSAIPKERYDTVKGLL